MAPAIARVVPVLVPFIALYDKPPCGVRVLVPTNVTSKLRVRMQESVCVSRGLGQETTPKVPNCAWDVLGYCGQLTFIRMILLVLLLTLGHLESANVIEKVDVTLLNCITVHLNISLGYSNREPLRDEDREWLIGPSRDRLRDRSTRHWRPFNRLWQLRWY